jgi:histidine decarboxylase
VAFYSEDTHYSHIKAIQAIDIPAFYQVGNELYPDKNPLNPGKEWSPEVPSKDGPLGPGSIDVEALGKLVDFFTEKGHPIYIILNYGSTFKGSYDDVQAVGEKLIPILQKNNMYERDIVLEDGRREKRRGFWIHIDGALGATYMPFLEMIAKNGLRDNLEPGPCSV